MATELTIHIGPPKTASTSLQSTLAANRQRLLRAGVLYPESPGHEPNQQYAAAVDLAAQTHTSRQLSRFSRALFHESSWYTGAWEALLLATKQHDGPVIWSSEAFTYLDETGVASLAEAVECIPTRVVVVRRDTRQQLVSAYLESARHDVVPSLEVYVRTVCGALLDGRPHEFDYLNLDRLIDQWAAVGTVTIAGDAGDPLRDTLRSSLSIITDGLLAEVGVEHRNQALSPRQIVIWQAHLRHTRPRHYGAMQEVLNQLLNYQFAVPTSGSSTYQTPQLTTEFAAVLEQAFNSEIPRSEQQIARSRLQAMLNSSEPLTTKPECLLPGEQHVQVLSLLRRRQLIADAKWSVIDAISKVVGRRRPLRIDWGAPDGWACWGSSE